MPKAVVLLSGGLDSATTVAIARKQGFSCYALSVAYGQRHGAELSAATQLADVLGVIEHRIMQVDLGQIGGSALTDAAIAIPESPTTGVPVTYVPARNTVLLSLALAWAEVIDSVDIFIGVNAVDYSGYPDCRRAFIDAFARLANLATRTGVEEGAQFRVHAPLLEMGKAEIIREGIALGLDYSLTVSCYATDENGLACGRCDACRLRAKGFLDAGIEDPTRYQ